MNTFKTVHVYTGPTTIVALLQSRMEDEDIYPIIKNRLESGLRAGFGGGLPEQIELYVREDEFEKANRIAEEILKEIDDNEEG